MEESALQQSRHKLAESGKDGSEIVSLRAKLEENFSLILSLEEELKQLKSKKSTETKNQDINEDISKVEIKLMATETDLDHTKALLKTEENKTQKQSLQVQMMKDR